MLRWFLHIVVVLGFLVVADTRAGMELVLIHPFDNREALRAVREDERVKGFGKGMDAFGERLLLLKERDFHALLGKPVNKSKDYTLSIAGPSSLLFSGVQGAFAEPNKKHTDFHVLGDHGGIEVYYQRDGVTPAAILLYFRVAEDFPRLKSARSLENRLCWEHQQFHRMFRHFKMRWRAVYEWEVDAEAERELSQGEDSPHCKAKLAAWIKEGERAGYRLAAVPKPSDSWPEWTWYGPGNRLVRQARKDINLDEKEAVATEFIRFHANGKPARRESGWPQILRIGWYREDGTLLRRERGWTRPDIWRANDWTWYDRDGKSFRHEEDTNGDGIPDTVNGKPLAVKDSWAVHPELVPKECTLPGLRARRVPLRKIPE